MSTSQFYDHCVSDGASEASRHSLVLWVLIVYNCHHHYELRIVALSHIGSSRAENRTAVLRYE
jgi:hypothetical protein